jgi:hypothetical protein
VGLNPLGQRILAEIQAAQLSASDRRELAAAISRNHGHRNPNAKWDSTFDCLVDLCEWASELPPEDLPPQEKDAARHFGMTSRSIGRWLAKAGIPGWDGFLRFWSLALLGE